MKGQSPYLKKKSYQEAEKAFFAICCFDPSHFVYWVGLAHSSFQNNHYEQAIDAYSIASGMDPENIWPHIWAANCFEAVKDSEHACMALSEALSLEKAKKSPDREMVHSLEMRLQENKKK